jgi:hypothetical protein
MEEYVVVRETEGTGILELMTIELTCNAVDGGDF